MINSSRIAVKNPQDYEARSNIMWTATWALNTLIGLGKQQDWMVHMIGHSVGAWTHAPHGYALASVSMAYYQRAMKYGLPKFVRFAKNVWNIGGDGMTDEQIAELEAHVTDINYNVAEERERIVRHDVMSHVYAYGQH